MPYRSVSKITKLFYHAHSCTFIHSGWHCAGGDYCPFPPGLDKMCCFVCPLFDKCPDKTGVCERFKR